MKSYTK